MSDGSKGGDTFGNMDTYGRAHARSVVETAPGFVLGQVVHVAPLRPLRWVGSQSYDLRHTFAECADPQISHASCKMCGTMFGRGVLFRVLR